jgi:hypothetical protein
LTALKSPEAPVLPEDEDDPLVGLAGEEVVVGSGFVVAAFVVVVAASFVVVGAASFVVVGAASVVAGAASTALLEVFFLHDLRPSEALGITGTSTGCSPRGLSWRRRMLAMWSPWPWEEASARTTRARTRAEVGSWKSMLKSEGGCGAARGTWEMKGELRGS